MGLMNVVTSVAVGSRVRIHRPTPNTTDGLGSLIDAFHMTVK
jgi:hypothetical protein